MSQTSSYVIANDAGLAVRQRINEVLAALQSSNAGATAPVDTRAGMLWLDTSGNTAVLRIRSAADDGWEDVLDGGSY
jgi:hypothetical protein